jgi:hypothetical protein
MDKDTNQDITLAVLNEKFENFLVSNNKDHAEIIKQTTSTNGKVADLNKWRYIITGGLIFSNIIIVPVIIVMMIKFLNLT